jgi:hypothetical protein
MPPGLVTPDFPSLFPLGFHPLSLEEVARVCVDLFPLSGTRATLMHGLEQFVQHLVAAGVVCDVWIDGSFLTEKIDPADVDVIVRCDHTIYDAGTTEQRDALDWVIENQKVTLRCDSYALFNYTAGHPLHTEGEWWYSYWLVKWGFNRVEDPKGIAVISLSGNAP